MRSRDKGSGDPSVRLIQKIGELIEKHTGMTPVQVLQAATINDAKLLGMEGKIGVIKQGAFADIIAIDGDPEKDFVGSIERVKFVMKEGRVYK